MLALTTDSLKGHGLNRIFQITKEAGFDGIDLSIEPKNYDTQDEKYIKKLSDQVGIPVLAISTPANSNEKKVKMAVKMAKKLDTKVIIIQPPKFFDYQYIRWLKKEVPLIRQKENISIALENAPSKSFLGIIPEHGMGNIMDLKKFKHACLDTARLGQKREDLIRVYKLLKKYVVHIHLSNLKAGTPYAPLNKGLLPLESFLTKLRQDDFPGTISLKLNGKFLDVNDQEKLIDNLKDQKKFFDSFFTNIKKAAEDEESDD